MTEPRTDTDALIVALFEILINEIHGTDGVALAVIAEAAERLREQKERIAELETYRDAHDWNLS